MKCIVGQLETKIAIFMDYDKTMKFREQNNFKMFPLKTVYMELRQFRNDGAI